LSCSSSLLNQWALYECLSSGEYDRHVKRLKRVLRHQKCRMISLIEHCFPKGTRVSDPQGGCVLWLELPKGFHSETLFHLALDNHISLAPGAIFSPTSKYKSCFRISYGLPWTEQLETGVQTLGEITRTLLEES